MKVGEGLGSTRTGSRSEGEADRYQMGNKTFVLEVQYGDELVHIQMMMFTLQSVLLPIKPYDNERKGSMSLREPYASTVLFMKNILPCERCYTDT